MKYITLTLLYSASILMYSHAADLSDQEDDWPHSFQTHQTAAPELGDSQDELQIRLIKSLEIVDNSKVSESVFSISTPLRFSEEVSSIIRDFMAMPGILDKCDNELEINKIIDTLEEFSEEECLVIIDFLKMPGVLDKCENISLISGLIGILGDFLENQNQGQGFIDFLKMPEVRDKCENGTEISNIICAFNELTEEKFPIIMDFMKMPEVLGKCEDGWEISNLICAFNELTEEKFPIIMDFMKMPGVLDKCEERWEILNILDVFGNFSEGELPIIIDFIKTPEVLDKCEDGVEISNIISSFGRVHRFKFSLIMDFMKMSGIPGKCEDGLQISEVVDTLGIFTKEQLPAIIEWVNRSRVLDKCGNGFDIMAIFETLKKGIPHERLIGWMKETGVWDKCKDGSQISEAIDTFDMFTEEQLPAIIECVKRSEILVKCDNGSEILEIFSVLNKSLPEEVNGISTFLEERFALAIELVKTPKLLDKCRNGWDATSILGYLLRNSKERIILVTELMKIPGVLDKCENGSQISTIIGLLSVYNEEFPAIIEFMKIPGFLGKCENGWRIAEILNTIHKFPKEQLPAIIEFMKESGILDKCRDGASISELLGGLQNFDLTLLSNPNAILPIEVEFLPIYVIGSALESISDQCTQALEKLIENPQTREVTLIGIINFLGEENEISQRYLTLAAGYDNANDPNGFLAVYREMMEQRDIPVEHRLRTQTPGVLLNLDYIKNPRPLITIPMPVNVWTQLFEKFKKVDKQSLSDSLGGFSYDQLLSLEENETIREMLDPQDSLVAKRSISSYSFMLRDVLRKIKELQQINPEQAMASFSQLLINITTCLTGKLNGIAQTHRLMNQDTVLDENQLGTTLFTQEIVRHFNEELRRFREGTLSAVVKLITKQTYADPHDVYYIRGIIGRDIGILFPDETPRIDINGNGVNQDLRQRSKQELLDLFYQYYTVEEVINIIHTKLNNRSFKVEDLNSGQDLTLRVINEYLRENAYNISTEKYNPEYIIIKDGNPIGFTPVAAKDLLFQLGFLTDSPR